MKGGYRIRSKVLVTESCVIEALVVEVISRVMVQLFFHLRNNQNCVKENVGQNKSDRDKRLEECSRKQFTSFIEVS